MIWNCQRCISVVCFFFFQAEDGIRDLTVTGVQTCALPIFRMSGWVSSSAPTRPERLVVSTLNAPGGSPASSATFAIASAVSGVADAGLRTTVHPAARAGAILRVTIVARKFHGVTAATGPTGWRSTQYRLPGWGAGIHSPLIPPAPPADQPEHPREN